ncbi:MAG: SUMF1/EgtB/PvdO family nonheme iron enzyme [Fuerstiella sp.]
MEEEKRLAEKAERRRVAEKAEQKRKAEEEQKRLAEEAERKQIEHPVPAANTSEPEDSNSTLRVAVVSFFLGVAVTSLLVYVIMYDVKVEERRPDDEFTDLEQGTTLEESGEYPALMTNSIGMNLKLIPAGVFLMGSPVSEAFRGDHESQHRVRITKPFYIQTTEVTWGQWKSVMGAERWRGQFDGGDNYAANYVSHDDAVEFLRKLSAREGVTYRLPTEAEWEYACRGGSTGMYSFGTSVGQLGQYAWFKDNAYDINEKYVHRVGQNRANDFGLYDMHGNVFEWCSDWYDKDYYKSSSVNDPQGPSSGSDRVYRGGGWSRSADCCRSAHRYRYSPSDRTDSLGFRVARSSVQ